MEFLGSWILGISAAALVYSAVLSLAPEGQARRVVRLAGGGCVLVAVFLPIAGIDAEDFSATAFAVSDEYAEAAERLDRTNYDIQKSIIEDRTAAYIAQKADALGLVADVEVFTQPTDGVPMPSSVDCKYSGEVEAAEKLRGVIAAELGIPAGAQRFSEREP